MKNLKFTLTKNDNMVSYKSLSAQTELKQIFENSLVGIFRTDISGNVILANPSGLRILKYESVNQMNTIGLRNIYKDPLERKRLLNLAMRGPVEAFETILIRGDGEDIVVFIKSFPVFSEDGHLRFLENNIIDITKQREIETQLRIEKTKAEESKKLISSFLANMSHEVRTPMNSILGFTQLLKGTIHNSEHQEYFEHIERNAYRLHYLIEDLISISKIEAKQIKANYTDVNINEKFQLVYDLLRPEAKKKGIEFSFCNDLKDSNVSIKTDSNKFQIILIKLIQNAIKFTKEGFVVFKCERKNGFIEFVVDDTGIGIHPNRRKQIFRKFVQADNSYIRNFEGIGLGLAITKAYVELLGGKILVRSKTDRGSQFYFTIPIL